MTATTKMNLRRLDLQVVGGRKVDSKRKAKATKARFNDEDRTENNEIIQHASNLWNALDTWRENYKRNRRYIGGDQWGDLVYDPDRGGYIREEELIKEQGQVPLVINKMTELNENILGQFDQAKVRPNVIARTREESPVGEMLTNTLWSIEDANNMWGKDTTALDVFLSSAVIIQRLDYGPMPESKRWNARFKNISLGSAFFTQPREEEGYDITFVGMFHDVPLNSVISNFAKNEEDEKYLRDHFRHVDKNTVKSDQTLTDDERDNKDFYFPSDMSLCRVYEVWRKLGEWRYEYHDPYEGIYDSVKITPQSTAYFQQENEARIAMAQEHGIESPALIEYEKKFVEYWHYKYITNDHLTLDQGETPFEHGGHPFVMLFDRIIDGKVSPFMNPVVDIQRSFNRDRIMLDFTVGASTKGSIYFDEKHLAEDMTPNEAVAQYSKRNGVIRLDLKPGVKASDVIGELGGRGMPAGLNESLAIGERALQQMGGVSDALQGRTPSSGIPASLYAQSAQNSTLNIRARMSSVNRFRSRRGKKLLQNANQYYDEKVWLTVNGNSETVEYDKTKIREDLEFETTIGQGADSQIYRALMDDWINQWMGANLLPFKIGLKNISYPGADKLLNDIEEFEKAQTQGAVGPDGMPIENSQMPPIPQMAPGLVEMMRQQGGDASKANPETVNLMQRFAGKDIA